MSRPAIVEEAARTLKAGRILDALVARLLTVEGFRMADLGEIARRLPDEVLRALAEEAGTRPPSERTLEQVRRMAADRAATNTRLAGLDPFDAFDNLPSAQRYGSSKRSTTT